MNPSYMLQIDIVLRKVVGAQDILMRHIRYVPFVPRSGDVIRLTSENEEDILDLSLEAVVYDAANGYFVAELEDETLINEIREEGQCNDKQAVESYKAFGFSRLTFPTAQVIRAAP